MDEWGVTVYDLDAPEFTLERTGLFNHKGQRIYRKPVVGFHGPLSEYVVVIDDDGEEEKKKGKEE